MLEKKNAPVGTCNLLLVLGMLEDGERAGHEIITALERQCDRTFSGQEGAIYPLLHQLEERGDIRSRERTDGGRPRRVYRLTRQGHENARPLPPGVGALPAEMRQSCGRR